MGYQRNNLASQLCRRGLKKDLDNLCCKFQSYGIRNLIYKENPLVKKFCHVLINLHLHTITILTIKKNKIEMIDSKIWKRFRKKQQNHDATKKSILVQRVPNSCYSNNSYNICGV